MCGQAAVRRHTLAFQQTIVFQLLLFSVENPVIAALNKSYKLQQRVRK